MKNVFAPSAVDTLAFLMLSPRLRSAAVVSSSSPSLPPYLTVTTVAKESEVLSMTTTGVGTADAAGEEGATVAGVALQGREKRKRKRERERKRKVFWGRVRTRGKRGSVGDLERRGVEKKNGSWISRCLRSLFALSVGSEHTSISAPSAWD